MRPKTGVVDECQDNDYYKQIQLLQTDGASSCVQHNCTKIAFENSLQYVNDLEGQRSWRLAGRVSFIIVVCGNNAIVLRRFRLFYFSIKLCYMRCLGRLSVERSTQMSIIFRAE